MWHESQPRDKREKKLDKRGSVLVRLIDFPDALWKIKHFRA